MRIFKILFSFLMPIFAGDELAMPAHTDSSTVVVHKGYTLCYDEEHEQAKWVAYRLTAKELKGKAKRHGTFKQDPLVSTGSANTNDYKYSGYDRGHLAPAADMAWSKDAMKESFYTSNISPQHPSFNRGIWKKLESQVRKWAKENDELLIVTAGMIFDTTKIGDVSVPMFFYKVILDNKEPERKAIAFILLNEKSNIKLENYAVTVDFVEAITKINFFPTIEDSLEAKINKDLWFK